MCTSIMSLSKITHQIWHEHPSDQEIRQLNKGGGGGFDRQSLKKTGRPYSGSIRKIGV